MHSEIFKHAKQARARGPYLTDNARTAIGKARRNKGLTQADAAQLCGVGLRTYQRAEWGDVLEWRTKKRIERALGIGL